MVSLTFRESIWQEHSVLSTNPVQLKKSVFNPKDVGNKRSCTSRDPCHAQMRGIKLLWRWVTYLTPTFYFTPAPSRVISSWFSLVTDQSPSLTPAINLCNNRKHVRFTTWGLSLPQLSRLFWGLGAVRGSHPLMQSHIFVSWPSSTPTQPASLPSIWQLQVWSCPPPVHSSKGNRIQSRGLICVRAITNSRDTLRFRVHLFKVMHEPQWCLCCTNLGTEFYWVNALAVSIQ